MTVTRRPCLVLLALAACVPVAACGGSTSSGGRVTYPSAAERSFLAACARQPGATGASCACTVDRLQDRISYGQLRGLGLALRTGGTVDPLVRTRLRAAQDACD
jgi:hypothetical protein